MCSSVTSGATSFSFCHQPLHAVGVARGSRPARRPRSPPPPDSRRRTSRPAPCRTTHRNCAYPRTRAGPARNFRRHRLRDSSHTACHEPTSDQPIGDRHHRGALGLFHHRVVDRLRLGAPNACASSVTKPRSLPALLDRGLRGGRRVRLESAVFVEEDAGAENEIAGVPEIALRDIALGGLGIRLLDELLDREHIVAERGARADIAVFRRRPVRPHAEGDDPAAGGGVGGACGRRRRKPAVSLTT